MARITVVNLASVDLNLFVVLRAVLDEGSATKAAARLNVTQSAVSNALARLRVLLDDPLVVRTGRGLTPTPRALAIAPRLSAALSALEEVTSDLATFDLATTRRTWSMAFAELYGPTLLPGLYQQMQTTAPEASLRVITVDRMAATNAMELGDLDLYLGIAAAIPAAWRSEPAFTDDIVGIVRAGHPLARRDFSLEDYLSIPHAHVRVTPERGGEVDDALARIGRTRRVVVTAPHYSSAVPVVEVSDCATAIPRRLANHYARTREVEIFEIPLTLPAYDIRLHWHARVDADPGVAALRSMVHDVVATR